MPNAQAQTIYVNTVDGDVIDVDVDTATVDDLPGPDGLISFSEAVIASNNSVGRQHIGFQIPASELDGPADLYPGRAVIQGSMFYANFMTSAVIDGRTQTEFTGDSNPDGHEIVILRSGGLWVPANSCVISGLDHTSMWVEGDHCRIQHNSRIGLDLYQSADCLVDRNINCGYINLTQTTNCIVTGNLVDLIRVSGNIAGGQPALNNRIGGPAVRQRNIIRGSGYRNNQGIPGGFALLLFDTVGTTVENNWIGLAEDGLSQGHSMTTIGLSIDSENHFTSVWDNRISGIRATALPSLGGSYQVGTAIQVDGTGTSLEISGNQIGLNAQNQPTLGAVIGIDLRDYYLGPMQGTVIGGATFSDGNTIAGQLRDAIVVGSTHNGVLISRNSIFGNGGLGIDLIDSSLQHGVTFNDSLDTDSGVNGLENYPIIKSAVRSVDKRGRATLQIKGQLSGSASTNHLVEFFASAAPNASGYGEGQWFLIARNVKTNAAGVGDFNFSLILPNRALAATHVTATSTTAFSTSEFSGAVQIVPQ